MEGADPGGREFYVLIFDSATDSRVASDIRDKYQGLADRGYSSVLGLRDVYPEPQGRIPAMRKAIAKILPKGDVPVHLVLCIMEIEAWFIAEYTHFAGMDARITLEEASKVLGANVETVDVETIAHPAEALEHIYAVAGLRYQKNKAMISKMLNKLDFERLYLELSGQVSALGELCQHLDAFLVRPSPANPTC